MSTELLNKYRKMMTDEINRWKVGNVKITLDQVGTATLVATGDNGVNSASLTVHVLAVGPTTTPGATTVAGGGASNAAAGSDSSGLARTGASIAGPLAIGFVALFAGLALLFFGTRGVRQRKSARLVE